MIGAVVLAAGESRRMGVPKLLLPYRGSTMLESVLEAVTASGVAAAVVVLGAGRGALRKKIRRFPVSEAVNPRFRQGMLSSIQCGIAALPGSCRAALVVLGDQPDVSSGVIDALIAAFREGHQGIVVPVFKERRGHPLLVDLKYRDEIAALAPETGLRGLLSAHPDDILEVVLPEEGILRDIDTPEEYRQALRQAGRRDIRGEGDTVLKPPAAEGGPSCLEGESAPPSPFQRSLRSLPPLLGPYRVLRPRGDIPLDPLPRPKAGEPTGLVSRRRAAKGGVPSSPARTR